MPDTCTAPEHTKLAAPLYDARGIFVCYTCPACEGVKRGYYREDIFTDPGYWADEPIDFDGW